MRLGHLGESSNLSSRKTEWNIQTRRKWLLIYAQRTQIEASFDGPGPLDSHPFHQVPGIESMRGRLSESLLQEMSSALNLHNSKTRTQLESVQIKPPLIVLRARTLHKLRRYSSPRRLVLHSQSKLFNTYLNSKRYTVYILNIITPKVHAYFNSKVSFYS